MILLSVDPGCRYLGAALFQDGKLIAAASIRNPAKEGSGPRECAQMADEVTCWACVQLKEPLSAIDHFVAEVPQIYQRGAGKSVGDPNGLLPLAMVDGALAGLLLRNRLDIAVTYYQPKEWGAVGKPEDKDVGKIDYAIESRMRERLTPEELACIVWPWGDGEEKTKAAIKRSFDVTDAVMIGMKALGRFERKRVFARE